MRTATWYAVVRLVSHRDNVVYGEEVLRALSRVPVGVFPSRTAADERCADLLARARRTLNPFEVFDAYMREDVDAVAALGIAFGLWPPPEYDGWVDWSEWYDAVQDELTDADRAKLWGLVAFWPLYEIAELEVLEG